MLWGNQKIYHHIQFRWFCENWYLVSKVSKGGESTNGYWVSDHIHRVDCFPKRKVGHLWSKPNYGWLHKRVAPPAHPAFESLGLAKEQLCTPAPGHWGPIGLENCSRSKTIRLVSKELKNAWHRKLPTWSRCRSWGSSAPTLLYLDHVLMAPSHAPVAHIDHSPVRSTLYIHLALLLVLSHQAISSSKSNSSKCFSDSIRFSTSLHSCPFVPASTPNSWIDRYTAVTGPGDN